MYIYCRGGMSGRYCKYVIEDSNLMENEVFHHDVKCLVQIVNYGEVKSIRVSK